MTDSNRPQNTPAQESETKVVEDTEVKEGTPPAGPDDKRAKGAAARQESK